MIRVQGKSLVYRLQFIGLEGFAVHSSSLTMVSIFHAKSEII